VLDALREAQGCPFCAMRNKLEKDAISFIMGPAYMEDDVRMATNELGFCKTHLESLYAEQNRLGLALMLHTHMQQLNKDTNAIIKSKIPNAGSLFSKAPKSPLVKHLEQTISSCYVCDKVENTFARYIDTFFYLWGRGGDEARLIANQTGYCLPHFMQIIDAADKLSKSKKERFMEEVLPIQQRLMQQLEEDLEWFIFKFDYRNADAPWKNAKEALIRALALLGGEKTSTK